MTNRTRSIDVANGQLTVGIWGPDDADGPTVLALHGITASHQCWPLVAERLPGVRMIAPDLRGRGRSVKSGPHGMRQHAADLVRVLDAFELDDVVVLAHSMGAFVAITLTGVAPERVAALVLVDGGIPLPRPADAAASTDLGPAAQRLMMTFPDQETYRDFWRQHPAFLSSWNAAVQNYVDYDLEGSAPQLRSSASATAVSADAGELFGGSEYEAAMAAVAVPVTFLRAPRGLLDEPLALYPPQAVQEARSDLPQMSVVEVDDVNHYTIILGSAGAQAVATEVLTTMSRLETTATQGAPSP